MCQNSAIESLKIHAVDAILDELDLKKAPLLRSFSSYAKASVLNLGQYGFRGGASLQIENAQLKLHFSTCMLVLSFE